MNSEHRGPMEHLSALLALLTRFSQLLSTTVEARKAQLIAFERMEIQRAAKVFALTLVAALLACAAVGFAAIAVLNALGQEHRTLVAAVIAVSLALLALLAVLLARDPR